MKPYLLSPTTANGHYEVHLRDSGYPTRIGTVAKVTSFGLVGWRATDANGVLVPWPPSEGGRWRTRTDAADAVWDRHLHPMCRIIADDEHYWPADHRTIDYLIDRCEVLTGCDDDKGAYRILPGVTRDDLDLLIIQSHPFVPALGNLTP